MPRALPEAPVLSILVVSYNTRDMTLECLRSVIAQTRTPFELIVLDNASSDGSAEAIAVEFPDITLLAETRNHGFARANNIAAEHAKGEYLLLLNPDTIVLDGALDKLLTFARRAPDARIWGGRTVFARWSAQSGFLLAPNDAVEPDLPGCGAHGDFPEQRLAQPRRIWWLGSDERTGCGYRDRLPAAYQAGRLERTGWF